MNDSSSSSVHQAEVEVIPYRGNLEQTVTLALPQAYDLSPLEARRVASLERRAPRIVERASQLGVKIEYIGTGLLFDEHRFYRGVDTDWVLKPADDTEEIVVPRAEAQALRKLHADNLDFPCIYVAHEVPKAPSSLAPVKEPGSFAPIEPTVSSQLIGEVPAPSGSLELADRLNHRSVQVLNGLKVAVLGAAVAAGAVAVAPIALVGGALAAVSLDPIVIGAIPAISPEVGSPAAFYVLARWDW